MANSISKFASRIAKIGLASPNKFEVEFPNIDILPFVGVSNKASKCKKVDLPEPDGPIKAITFPDSTIVPGPRV